VKRPASCWTFSSLLWQLVRVKKKT